MLVDIANTILDLLRRPTGGHTSMPAECLARAWLTDISVTRIDSRAYIASCNTVMLSLCHALVGRPMGPVSGPGSWHRGMMFFQAAKHCYTS